MNDDLDVLMLKNRTLSKINYTNIFFSLAWQNYI